MALCKVCGRTVGSAGFSIEPDEKIPEIKKTVHFCGERCMNAYLGRIKAKYKKQLKQSVRKALETTDRKPTSEDLVAIYQTLTEKEKQIMFLVGFNAAYFSSLTIKNFYKNLNALSEKK